MLSVLGRLLAQPCSKESFSSISDDITGRGYKIIDMKAEAAVVSMGAMNYIFFVEPGNDYVFVLKSQTALGKSDFLAVNVYDSAGKIASRFVNNDYVEVHFTARKSEYITIDSFLKSNDKFNDRLCMFHLMAVRRLDDGR